MLEEKKKFLQIYHSKNKKTFILLQTAVVRLTNKNNSKSVKVHALFD